MAWICLAHANCFEIPPSGTIRITLAPNEAKACKALDLKAHIGFNISFEYTMGWSYVEEKKEETEWDKLVLTKAGPFSDETFIDIGLVFSKQKNKKEGKSVFSLAQMPKLLEENFPSVNGEGGPVLHEFLKIIKTYPNTFSNALLELRPQTQATSPVSGRRHPTTGSRLNSDEESGSDSGGASAKYQRRKKRSRTKRKVRKKGTKKKARRRRRTRRRKRRRKRRTKRRTRNN